MKPHFDWDSKKDVANQIKHGVSFAFAQLAFLDSKRVILIDEKHRSVEQRFYCIGKIDDDILTVRFTYRKDVIRIFGAGYWRKGKQIYEKHNQVHG